MFSRIVSDNIILRKAKKEDLNSIFEHIWSDKNVYDWMYFKPAFTIDEAIEKMDKTIEFQKKVLYSYFVALKSTDEVIGLCAMIEYEPHRFHEAGIGVGTKFQGLGYGKEILKLLLDLAFNKLEGIDFRYSFFEGNIKSKKLAESYGFIYDHSEEVTRPWDLKKMNMHTYFLKREDWLKLSK